ncbi:Methionine gamma-lyase [compost metagenome]
MQLFIRMTNIGDVKSLATHLASAKHHQLDPEERTKAGASDAVERLYVGIEHIDDLRRIWSMHWSWCKSTAEHLIRDDVRSTGIA